MEWYVLKKLRLLKNKKFMKSLCLNGIEIGCFSKELGKRSRILLFTNQEINLGKWIREKSWTKLVST